MAPRVAVGRWTHVAITANAAVVRIYVNDVLAARRATRGAVAWGDVLKVGGGFVGRVDEVRVLVGARSAAGLHADARHPVPSRRTSLPRLAWPRRPPSVGRSATPAAPLAFGR